jgi:hypothetical protein
MLQNSLILNTSFWTKTLSIGIEYPIRIILIGVGIWVGVTCIKQRHFLSCLVLLLHTVLLTVVTFTNLLTSPLKSVPTLLQYGGVAVLTVLYCIIYEYESSRE